MCDQMHGQVLVTLEYLRAVRQGRQHCRAMGIGGRGNQRGPKENDHPKDSLSVPTARAHTEQGKA